MEVEVAKVGEGFALGSAVGAKAKALACNIKQSMKESIRQGGGQ